MDWSIGTIKKLSSDHAQCFNASMKDGCTFCSFAAGKWENKLITFSIILFNHPA